MDRLDRLLMKVVPKLTVQQRLSVDNPYMGKTGGELLDYLNDDNYHAPEMRTPEWDKYIYALVHAVSVGN